ncbi:MAG: hypothetical protein AAFP69_05755 [Planctomycetota bacterium]
MIRFAISRHIAGPQLVRDIFVDNQSAASPISPGDHFDWFFDLDPLLHHASGGDSDRDDDRCLHTWATKQLPRDLATIVPICESWQTQNGAIPAQQLPPHRRRYLNYSGRVSGDRGQIQQITSGWIESATSSPDSSRVEMHLVIPAPTSAMASHASVKFALSGDELQRANGVNGNPWTLEFAIQSTTL